MFDFQASKSFRNKRVRVEFKEEVEPQEILLDALSNRKELLSQKKFEVPLKKRVWQLFSFLFLASFLLLTLKTFQLQILENNKFLLLSEKSYQRVYHKRADRGVIYDKDLNQLVFNESRFDLVCNKQDLPYEKEKRQEVLRLVSEITKIEQDALEKEIEESKPDEILIAEDLDHEVLIVLDSKIKDLTGFLIEENIKRFYVSGPILSHVIGFLGRIEKEELEAFEGYSPLDYIGKSGLEKSYQEILKGKKGETMVKRDVFSQEVFREKVSEPESGQSLVLWLDSGLQEKIFQSLASSLEKVGAKAGAAVAMNPKTGGILALVSLPSFDNNLFFQKISSQEWEKILQESKNPFWNRVISAAYPTGSTIKPLIATAALEEEVVWPEKNIFCEGKIEISNPWFEDQPWFFHDWRTHGWTDIRKAIAESCNVYFYTIGGGYEGIEGLGGERIKNYLELFGWGSPTGVDISGEREGLIPDREWKKAYFENKSDQVWLPGDSYNLSIGQGYLSITPIQVVSSFSVIANGGKLLKPILVKEIVDGQKNTVEKSEPFVLRKDFISSQNLKVVREGMRQAVTYGSSYLLNDLPVKAAAKTGTAQTSKRDYYHNWITVFAPYEDPEIVLTIVIEDVPEEQVAALPVAREVLNWYFSATK